MLAKHQGCYFFKYLEKYYLPFSKNVFYLFFFFFFFFIKDSASEAFPEFSQNYQLPAKFMWQISEICSKFQYVLVTTKSPQYSEYKSRGYVWFVVICIIGNFNLFPPKLFPISFSFLVSLTQGIHFLCLFLSVIWLRLKVIFGPFAKRSFIH